MRLLKPRSGSEVVGGRNGAEDTRLEGKTRRRMQKSAKLELFGSCTRAETCLSARHGCWRWLAQIPPDWLWSLAGPCVRFRSAQTRHFTAVGFSSDIWRCPAYPAHHRAISTPRTPPDCSTDLPDSLFRPRFTCPPVRLSGPTCSHRQFVS